MERCFLHPKERQVSSVLESSLLSLRQWLPVISLRIPWELRQKQSEIDRLYGKLAAGHSLAEPEMSQKLQEVLARLAQFEHS